LGQTFKLPEDADKVPVDVLASLFHANFGLARQLYLQAISEGKKDVVVAVDAIAYKPEDPRKANWKAAAFPNGNPEIVAVVEDHNELFKALCKASYRAALDLGETPDAAKPFVFVVMSARGLQVHKFRAPRDRDQTLRN
jgi:hypothetical protein